MATYSNIGIKLITTGDESGTWGDTTNTNFSDILDEAIAGAVTYNISSDADVTLTVSDGSSSDARHAVIKFTSTTLTATRTVTFAPDTLQKTWLVINSTTGGQSLTFKQGSAGATVTVPNGESAIIYSDGAGATNGAIVKALDSFTNTKITTGTLNATTLDLTNLEVTNVKAKDGTAAFSIADSTGKVTVSSELAVDNLNLSGNAITSTDSNGNIDLTPNGTGEVNITKVDIDAGAIDGTTIGGASAAAGTFTTLTATTLGGALDANNQAITNINVDSGAIDGTPIGANSAATGAFTTATATTGNITTVNATTVDSTNVEVTAIKAKDGTSAATIADVTGVVTITANPILNSGTANGVLYLNGSKAATSGSALTFDGTSMTFADNSKAIFGAGSDLEIYHDGSNSYVKENGTGQLIVNASNFYLRNSANTNDYLTAVDGGSVKLLYANAEKLATTATGIDVTGTVTADGADLNGAVVINESGADVDFRVESDTNTHALFVQGSDGNVGIGTSSPAGKLQVYTSANRYQSFTSASADFEVVTDNNTNPAVLIKGTGTADLLNVFDNTTEVFTILDGGNVGIGTSSPAAKLDVGGNTASTVQAIFGRGVSDSDFSVRFTNGVSGTTAVQGALGLDYGNGTWADMAAIKFIRNSTSGELAFFASTSSSSGAEQMRLTSTGLGIGTASPAAKFHTQQAGSAGVVVGAYLAATGNGGSGRGTGLLFGAPGSSSVVDVARIDGLQNTAAATANDAALVFNVSNTSGTLTERLRIDSSGNVGIGTTSPGSKLEISASDPFFTIYNTSTGDNGITWESDASSGASRASLFVNYSNGELRMTAGVSGNAYFQSFYTNGTERLRIDSSGNVGIGTSSPTVNLEVSGSASSVTARITTTAGSGNRYSQLQFMDGATQGSQIYQNHNGGALAIRNNTASGPIVLFTNDTTNTLTYDASGNLGLGVTPGTWTLSGASAMQIKNAGWMGYLNNSYFTANASNAAGAWKYIANGTAALYEQVNGTHAWSTAASGTAGNTITFTQALTLDANSKLAVNNAINTSPRFAVQIGGSDRAFFDYVDTSGDTRLGSVNSQPLAFYTNNAEKARITSGGDLLVGKTANDTSNEGFVAKAAGGANITSDDSTVLEINRKTSDGTLVSFRQDNTQEGTISVSGNTVSYNPFMGSHYTEIVGTMPTLKGTVLESLDELVSNKYTLQDRLPKAKISDTVGSSAVYGVYFSPDSDPETNDGILAAALGASWVRIASGVTVQRGDLLESNGDGCAKVQSDDIIRSKTIGKVTSTAVADTYADGSYIVPCVLYCG